MSRLRLRYLYYLAEGAGCDISVILAILHAKPETYRTSKAHSDRLLLIQKVTMAFSPTFLFHKPHDLHYFLDHFEAHIKTLFSSRMVSHSGDEKRCPPTAATTQIVHPLVTAAIFLQQGSLPPYVSNKIQPNTDLVPLHR